MNLVEQITQMIERDLFHGRQLLDLLDQETVAAKTRNFDLLDQLLEQKLPLMEHLKSNGLKREKWLADIQKSHKDAHWQDLLDRLKDGDLKEKWDEARDTILRCQEINNVNGKLIGRGLKTHEKLLQIMRGNTAENTSEGHVYNARGTRSGGYGAARYTQA